MCQLGQPVFSVADAMVAPSHHGTLAFRYDSPGSPIARSAPLSRACRHELIDEERDGRRGVCPELGQGKGMFLWVDTSEIPDARVTVEMDHCPHFAAKPGGHSWVDCPFASASIRVT